MKTLTVGKGAARALLVHGNDLCAEFYLPLADALARRGVTTTLLTLPGFHEEPPLAAPGWHELVDEVLAALPGPGTALLGHSMGGLLALLAAARRPPELRGLVLLEPTIFPWRWLGRLAASRYLRGVVRGERDRFVNENGAQRRVAALERFPRAMIDLYLEVRASSDVETAEALFTTLPSLYPLPFARISLPTLLLVGAQAGYRSRALSSVVARRLGAPLVVVPEAAHWLANEQDDVIAQQIARFLARLPPTAPSPAER